MNPRFRKSVSIMFVLPAFLIVGAFMLYPIIYSIKLSLSGWVFSDGPASNLFVGGNNFIRAFQDPHFIQALGNTFIYVLLSLGFTFMLGLLIALLLNVDTPGKKYLRTCALIPIMLSPIVAGLLWKYMYMARYGIINYFLQLVGISAPLWFSNSSTALLAVEAVQIWQTTPLSIIILLAGLQTIPMDILAAAKVDGTSKFQSFWYITFPLLKPAIIVSLLLQTIGSFRIFDQIYVLTEGGPIGSTESLSTYIVKIGMIYTRIGQATAYGIIALLIMVPMIILYVRNLLK